MDVIRKLEKENFTIFIPLKDKGIDLIAQRGKKFFQIQVKTSLFQKNSYFWFDLCKSKMKYDKNTYYIFVCKVLERRTFMGKSQNFIIINSLTLKEWIKAKKLPHKKNAPDVLNIFIYPNLEKKQWLFKNKGKQIDLTKFWNKKTFY